MKVVLKDNGNKYASASPNDYIKLFWISPEGQNCHGLTTCKGYIVDMIWAVQNKKRIYAGYDVEFDGATQTIRDNPYTIGIKKKGSMKQYVHQLQSLLDQLDDHFGYGRSVVSLAENNEEILIVEFSPKWVASPASIHFFLMLVRVGFYYNPNASLYDFLKKVNTGEAVVHTNDMGYIRNGWNRFEWIWLYKSFSCYKDTFSTASSEHYSHSTGFFNSHADLSLKPLLEENTKT